MTLSLQDVIDGLKTAEDKFKQALPIISEVVGFASSAIPTASGALSAVKTGGAVLSAALDILGTIQTNGTPTKAQWDALDSAVYAAHNDIQNQS